MDLQEELYRVLDALDAAGVDYALCGGLAVIVHGYPRLTRDIDILIRSEDLDSATTAVERVGFSVEAGFIPFGEGTATERRVFRVNKIEGEDILTLDLLLVSPFLEAVWSDRELHEVRGRTLRVVSREGLATMKRASGRAQDLEDLRQLGIDTGTNDA